jgi:predicted DNA-binding antitoxin AbrB/MazE fold protein
MSQTIEAIYEDGIFKPLKPVDLPEGTRVRVETEETSCDSDEQLRKQLIAEGASQQDAARIIENFRLLWDSYETLSQEQKEILDRSRLDQKNLFSTPSHQ